MCFFLRWGRAGEAERRCGEPGAGTGGTSRRRPQPVPLRLVIQLLFISRVSRRQRRDLHALSGVRVLLKTTAPVLATGLRRAACAMAGEGAPVAAAGAGAAAGPGAGEDAQVSVSALAAAAAAAAAAAPAF